MSPTLTKWPRERPGPYTSAHHLTPERCLTRLSDVRMCVADDEVRLEKAITRERRELLALCGVDAAGLGGVTRRLRSVNYKTAGN